MAQRIEEFPVPAVAGHTPTTPDQQFLDFTQGIVNAVDIVWPYGCNNLVGIQIWFSDMQVVPITKGSWATGNGRTQRYDLDNFPTGESWLVQVYNTDVLDHTPALYFFVDELGSGLDNPPDVILLPFLGSSLT